MGNIVGRLGCCSPLILDQNDYKRSLLRPGRIPEGSAPLEETKEKGTFERDETPRCREPFRIRGERQAGRGSIVQRVDSRRSSTRFPYRANENFTIGSDSRFPVSVWSMHAAQTNYLLLTRSVESRSFNGGDRRRNGKATTTTTTIVSILSFDSSIDRRIGW